MAQNTKIEWAHHTFNPWIGCTKVGSGCDNCYAEADFDKRRHVVQWGAGNPRKRTAPSTWAQPIKWNAEAQRLGVRYRVFCASLADVFDNAVPTEWRRDLLNLIELTPNLDWLLLTKRIGNVQEMVSRAKHGQWFHAQPNVWIGATIVNQEEADRDIPKLLSVPAAKRFLSMEPLLGPVDLGPWIGNEDCHVCGARFYGDAIRAKWMNSDPAVAVEFETAPEDENDIRRVCPACGQRDNCGEVGPVYGDGLAGGLDWIIVGGESGPGARPMHPDYVRSLRDQCEAAGVPFLFKQWGEWIPYEDSAQPPFKWSQHGHEIDGHLLPDFESEDGQRQREWHCDWSDMLLARRVGKKAAGRLLDGREWNGVPA
jgi:protein gp37